MKLTDIAVGSVAYDGSNYAPSGSNERPEERMLRNELRLQNPEPTRVRVRHQLIYVTYGHNKLSDGRLLVLQREVLSMDDGHGFCDIVKYVQNYGDDADWAFANLSLWQRGTYSILYFEKDSK